MWTASAVLLYLLPIVGFCVARWDSKRDALATALDLPLLVACDLLLVLLVSRFLVLDYAALSVRAAECVGLIWALKRRRHELRAAFSLPVLRGLAIPVLGALLALFLSTRISVPYAIWDRHWHIPLVTSLRGQHAPFHNVYEPERHIFYHYAGDALAAIFQALSFGHLHASAALSRAHDVYYALTGFCLGAALRALRVNGGALVLLTIFCTLVGGPDTVLFSGTSRWGTGWSTLNLLSLSFRPHEPLSFLFAITFALAGLGPLLRPTFSVNRAALPLLGTSAAVLALSDEPTLALVIGTVGVAWLVAPRALAGSWGQRARVALTALGAVIVTLLLLGGTFSLGAPHQAIELVRARLPGFYLPSLHFTAPDVYEKFLGDYAMPLGVLASGLLSAFMRRSSLGWTLLVAHLSLVVASLGILFLVRVNHDDMESHRAVTALMLLSPLLLALWFSRLPAGSARSWVLGVGGLACLFGAASTIEWERGIVPVDAPRLHSFWGNDWFYRTDCVAETGARLGERPMVSIGPETSWYLFAGCRPVFAPAGGPPGGHAIVVGWPDAGVSAFAKVASWDAAREYGVRVFYPNSASRKDVVAQGIRENAGNCRPAGTAFVECTPSLDEFADLAATFKGEAPRHRRAPRSRN